MTTSSSKCTPRCHHNLILIVDTLRHLSLRQVTVTYAGAAGKVTACDVVVSPHEADVGWEAMLVKQHCEAVSATTVKLSDVPLKQALKSAAVEWARFLDQSWPRGDGGYGTLRIHVETGELTLRHDAITIQNLEARLKIKSDTT